MRHWDNMLRPLFASAVEALGYELLGADMVTTDGGRALRVYIDHPDGIGLDDCATVSHQLSGILDVEDPIQGAYNLEVSSPGLDRPLFTPEQFARWRGRLAHIRLSTPVDGQRNLRGRLREVEGDRVAIECNEQLLWVRFDEIEKARLEALLD